MLALRPSCEHCNVLLPPESGEAMICSFECTFCVTCVTELLKEVCPNCGEGFEKRPVRSKELLIKYPASTTVVHKPVAIVAHLKTIKA